MIKRQALVPPWIEKQQALHAAAATFRARLRKDWTRHAVGMVTTGGGSVEEHIRRAKAYARAEIRQRGGDIPPPDNTDDTSQDLHLPPLRDPAWESQNLSYHTFAIAELNATARAYNLQAPELAKKPYYALEREIASCFADVAKALPKEVIGGGDELEEVIVRKKERDRGIVWRIAGEKAIVRDERGPKYGFKDLWRDMFR
ncbi:hypothetical protein V491_02498 [Pseudogymnoascus sp. VKM F-3775]|nr:hypothetical protein V491_02498 [Pseudogymnoascus sp. VKM F-3775]